jgi:hypothetical protein
MNNPTMNIRASMGFIPDRRALKRHRIGRASDAFGSR